MALVLLKKPDGSPVAVNTHQVRTVEPNRNGSTKINMPISPGINFVDVKDGFEETIKALNEWGGQ